eukprot:9542118-Karenia_brevis.AAC.1
MVKFQTHWRYHKKSPFLGSGVNGMQWNVIYNMYLFNEIRGNVSELFSSRSPSPMEYFKASAESIRQHASLDNIPNRKGWQ